MVKALVVYAHPCDDSFVASALAEVLAGLRDAGATVDVLDLFADEFDPRLTAEELAAHRGDVSTKPVALAVAPRLAACDTLVLVYPTWWGAQPAMLKGWFERTWVNGVAYHLEDGKGPKPALTNIRRIVAVTTHGSSKFVNSVQGETGKRFVKRSLRAAVGVRCRIEWLAIYKVDRSTLEQRQQFLAKVRTRFARR